MRRYHRLVGVATGCTKSAGQQSLELMTKGAAAVRIAAGCGRQLPQIERPSGEPAALDADGPRKG